MMILECSSLTQKQVPGVCNGKVQSLETETWSEVITMVTFMLIFCLYMKLIIHYEFVSPKLLTTHSTFNFWNV